MKQLLKVINASIDTLKYTYSHPKQELFGLGTFIAVLNTFTRITLMGLSLLKAINSNGDINVFMDALLSLGSFMMGARSTILLYFFKPGLRTALSDLDYFWTDHEPDYKNLHKIFKAYKYMVICTYISYIIISILGNSLLFDVWVPDFPHAYTVVLICQHFQLIIDICNFVAVDSFYIALCFVMTEQFELIGRCIDELNQIEDDDILYAKIGKCVQHHGFMLGYGNNIVDSFSISILAQNLTTTLMFCIHMYILSEGNTVLTMMSSLLYIGSMFSQLALYCIPANILSDAAEQIGENMYNFRWYEKSLKVQKCIPFVIHRSQRPLQFNGGGMFVITTETLTNVFNGSLSFYTFIKGLKEE